MQFYDDRRTIMDNLLLGKKIEAPNGNTTRRLYRPV